MNRKVVTNSRVKNSLNVHFKQFLDDEKIPEQINKKIEEHSIKKGLVKEVYHYLDTSLVELSNGKQVEAYHLHRTLGNIVDLFTPIGEQIISETKKEPCIIPRFQLKCLVAEVGKDEYVLLGYYNPNMVGSFSPADNGHYLIKTMTDGYQAGLDIFADNIDIISHQGASFIKSDVGNNTEIDYAESKDTYTKSEVYKKSQTYSRSEVYAKTETYGKNEVYRKAQTYNKSEVDEFIQEIWDYINPPEEETDENSGAD